MKPDNIVFGLRNATNVDECLALDPPRRHAPEPSWPPGTMVEPAVSQPFPLPSLEEALELPYFVADWGSGEENLIFFQVIVLKAIQLNFTQNQTLARLVPSFCGLPKASYVASGTTGSIYGVLDVWYARPLTLPQNHYLTDRLLGVRAAYGRELVLQKPSNF